MNKVLTVSIAAYNIASTLQEVVGPFLMDNVRNRVEVLIVDDGSKDDTAKLALEYQNSYPGTFRLIQKENGGWGSTLNEGFRVATGKYFKQLDGDDYFSYENLADYLDYLEGCNSDIVHTPFVTYSNSSGGILNVLNDFGWQDYSLYPKEKTISLSECPTIRPEMHNLTIRTALLREHPLVITEHCFYTDVEYALKSVNIARTISFYERPIYYYRLAFSGQSMGLGGIRKHYQDNQKMLLGMLAYYKNEVTELWAKEIMTSRLIAVCELMYRMFFALQCTRQQKRELIEFDSYLKNNYPSFYYSVSLRSVKLLRKINFFGYWMISHLEMHRDRKWKRNFFEGE